MVNTCFRKAEDEFIHLFLLNVNENILKCYALYDSCCIALLTKILLVDITHLKDFHNSALSDLMPVYLPVGRDHLRSRDNRLTTFQAFLSCSSLKVFSLLLDKVK